MAALTVPPVPPDDGGLAFDAEITELYDRHARQVYRVVRRGLVHEDAEEIVNFAFLAARLHWHRVRGYQHPLGYVFKAAFNLRADALELAARRPASLDDPDVDEPAAGSAGQPDVELLALRAALRKLTPREEQLVVLYYLMDLPAAEIAAALGISPGHISRTLSDARARLRDLLDPGSSGGGRHE